MVAGLFVNFQFFACYRVHTYNFEPVASSLGTEDTVVLH